MKFLLSKPDELVFNVPHGRIEPINPIQLKMFLNAKGENQKHFQKLSAHESGWKDQPFFIVDPFDRSQLPGVNAGLYGDSEKLKIWRKWVAAQAQQFE